MAKINFDELFAAMLAAFKKQLISEWPTIQSFATTALRKIAEDILAIEQMKNQHKISLEQAKLQINMQQDAAKATLLTVEGLSAVALQNALNAALDAVKDSVNTALHWALL